MSSSARSAPIATPPVAPPARRVPVEVVPFAYLEAPAFPNPTKLSPSEVGTPLDERRKAEPDHERESQLRELGRRQGLAEAHETFATQLGSARTAIAHALADFSRERTAYYRRVESEAVQLALAIARKVIHRESQVDPLLLMGIVRVALEQVEGATSVSLAVPASQAAEWQKFLATTLDAGDMPEILEDPTVASGQCILRTSLGTAEFGLEAQLKEIEKGLMDLLAARPQEKQIQEKPFQAKS